MTLEYQAKREKMMAYLERVKFLLRHFRHYSIEQIPGTLNTNAYALASLATASNSKLGRLIVIELLFELSVSQAKQIMYMET